MKTARMLTIWIVGLELLVLVARVGEAAAVGTGFTYQGHLYDNNSVADGLYDFQFKLYDADVNGNQLASDVNVPDLDVIDAYFTVELDFGSGVFDGNARWLEIGVRPGASTGGYTTLSPRQEVTATPYATSSYEVTGRVRTLRIYENLGSFWTAKDSNRSWQSVAMSADGQVQTVVLSSGQIYVSTDYGDSWTAEESNRYWRSVAMSADGQIQTAVVSSGQIYVSTDYGDSWTAKESNRSWQSVAMSADGTVQTAVVYGGQIYVSTDYGDSWTAKESNRSWRSVAMSADGQIQTAVVWFGRIYVSTDYGDTWAAKDSNRYWWSVAMSADGQIQTAVVSTGQIYVSTDCGDTWTAKESNRNWSSVAMSADGQIQTAVVNGGQIYVSTDSGNTWAAKESNRNWRSVAMSADGSIQTAVVNGGQIYLSSGGMVIEALHVVGNASISGNGRLQVGDVGVIDSEGMIRLESRSGTGGANRSWDIGVPETNDVVSGAGYSFVINDTFNGSEPEFMVKYGSGNVGIGTTSPTAALDVNGTAKILAWHDQQLDPNGYAWVGSILFQWGTAQSTQDTSEAFAFPTAFPNACFTVTVNRQAGGAVAPFLAESFNTTNFYIDRDDDIAGSHSFNYMAIGH